MWMDGWTVWFLEDRFKLYESVEKAQVKLKWKSLLEYSVCDAVGVRFFWEKIYDLTYDTRYNQI